jgi:capsular polysaccharide biosynthesis protein/Mrp family chromosome partitioning ATPase
MCTAGIGLLPFLRRWSAVVALATVAGGLLAYVHGSLGAPRYEAEAQLVVDATAGVAGVDAAAELAPTYAELVKSSQVLESALRSLGAPLTPDELRASTRGEAERETRLVRIRVRDGDPARTVALANKIAAELVEFVSTGRGEEPPTKSPSAGGPRLRIIEPASAANRIRPQLLLLTEFGALTAFFGALAVAVIVESRRRTLRNAEELADLTPVAVLGSVNGWPLSRLLGGRVAFRTRARLEAVEGYRKLARRIAIANGDEVPRSLLVVGAEGAEGSGTVAAKLALVLAGRAGRVTVADFGDGEVARFLRMWRPTAAMLGTQSRPLRSGDITLDRFQLTSGRPLSLAVPRDSSPRSVRFEAAREVMELLLAEADVLIVHGRPPSSSPDALAWARVVAAAVLVVRPDHTKRASVVSALQGLDLVRTNVVGAVLHTRR